MATVFEKAFQILNPQQKLAVETIDGPVMVIAGPGTGKTQVLAMRIANILLKTDTSPYTILALTFTESAAKNMRERLVQLIGPTAYSVHVQTFHSFCDEVIRSSPEYFPVSQESQVLSDLERYDLLEKLLGNPELTALRTINSPFHYLKPIMKAISDLKREGVSEKKFAELVEKESEIFAAEESELKKTELVRRKKNLEKQKELVLIYTQYQEQLRKKFRYDYDDMIAFVADAFEKEESLLLNYQEKSTYFLVDEYQDTNAAQNKVVDLLASYWGENANIFVVGDPHQSIYRFQGASLENTLNFVERYPAANMITLEVGYRCPQTIYDAAAEVIQKNSEQEMAVEVGDEISQSEKKLLTRIGKALKSVNQNDKKIQIYVAPSSSLETVFLAEEVQRLIASGVDPAEIALLYRNNSDALEISSALEKWEIPFVVDGGNNALEDPIVLQFLTLCKVIADIRTSNEGYELFEAMSFPWTNLDRVTVMTVARAAGKTKMSLFDRIQKGYVELSKLEFCEDVTAMDFAVLEDFLTKLVNWEQLDSSEVFPTWFEVVMTESGFLDWVLAQPNKLSILHHINALFREVKALSVQDHTLNLEKFLHSIETMREHGIPIATEELQTSDHAVTLSTVHKAKGREWEYVFLLQCIDGKWGNARSLNLLPLPEGILVHQEVGKQESNQDDRRLFYVAMTRAKKQFMITYPESVISANKPKLTMGSVFIEEMRSEHKEFVTAPELQEHAEKYLGKLLQVKEMVGLSASAQASERQFFQKIVNTFSLSVSSLNTYLRSVDEFIEKDLLKIPRSTQPYMAFGTAVHFALEQLYKQVLEKSEYPSQKFVLQKFQEAMEREVFTKEEFELRLKYGKKVLAAYFEEHKNDPVSPIIVEKFFGYGWSKTMLDDIQLVGRVDRIDWIDRAKKIARVIDYKTGHSRTINEIDGKVSTSEFSEREMSLPENIRGPFKRQLLFYKLLTQLDKNSDFTVSEGMFDFVEPDKEGKFVRRQLELKNEDVEALKELIREVMAEIRGLKFLSE